MTPANSSLDSSDAYGALRIRDFRWFVTARFALTFGIQMQSVIVGWQIYEITHDALSLGLIGLAEALPFFSISLFAGHVADSVNRKSIILTSSTVYFVSAAGLLLVSTRFESILQTHGVFPIYAIIFVTGLARGFLSPSQSAFMAQLVPRELYGNASTWSSVSWQLADVTGPAAGGLIYGFLGVGAAYSGVVAMTVIGLSSFTRVGRKPVPERKAEESIAQSLAGGLKFVFRDQVILSAISLDMFAVFFGGAVAVLPIFADQVLHIGAEGLGFLRAAPAVGSVLMSIIQAHHPFFKRAGRNLLICVLGFGLAIIAFALSKNFYLSLFILFVSGMFDNVSVVIRNTIIQLHTPDEMRGRVSAVNGIFVGSSNELGAFESGVAAKLIGLVPSVVLGGTMALLVVGVVRKFAPKLRRLEL
jgi:MFS family permease